MANRNARDEWLNDVADRQRNIVFPDTVQNEARFWRNIIEGKQKLTATQSFGLLLIALTVALTAAMFFYPSRNRLASALDWVVAAGFIGGLLLLIKWGTRKR